MHSDTTRRRFLAAGAGIVALASTGFAPKKSGKKKAAKKQDDSQPKPLAGNVKFALGLASYTTREFDLDQTIAMTKRLGMKYLCLKSFHLPLEASAEETARDAAKVRDGGLDLYSGGVISLKTQSEVDQAFEYAKAAGMKMIIAAPVVEMLPAINDKIKQYGIAVAIHNHGPGDKHFPTPESAYEKIKGMDKRFGLCMDVGHTVRIGGDPVASTKACADRLLDVHIKDVSAASAEGHSVPCGWGVIDLKAYLASLIEVDYRGVLSFEYEEHAEDPMPGLAESVGYIRGLLAGMA